MGAFADLVSFRVEQVQEILRIPPVSLNGSARSIRSDQFCCRDWGVARPFKFHLEHQQSKTLESLYQTLAVISTVGVALLRFVPSSSNNTRLALGIVTDLQPTTLPYFVVVRDKT